jgi:tRNA threonylcarbamoyladenosine biosynthesis protein TsaB
VNNILALDTSTSTLGLCLRTPGGLSVIIDDIELKHAQTLLPRIQDLLAEASISAAELGLVVCSLGPGSFTGVRIGLATAKGLAMGSGARLIGVSNLDAFAYRWSDFPGQVLPVLSALRGRFYACFYSNGRRLSEYLDRELGELADLAASAAAKQGLLLTGPDCTSLHEELQRRGLRAPTLRLQASAASDPRSLLEVGISVSARPADEDPEPLPLYLRKSDAELKREKS